MQSISVFLFLLALRVASVFLVRTWYVPDEYWQSLEVGHHLAFGWVSETGVASGRCSRFLEFNVFMVVLPDTVTWRGNGPKASEVICIRCWLPECTGCCSGSSWTPFNGWSWCPESCRRCWVPWRIIASLPGAIIVNGPFLWSPLHGSGSIRDRGLCPIRWRRVWRRLRWAGIHGNRVSFLLRIKLFLKQKCGYLLPPESTSFIWLVGLVSFIRPTAAIPWLPLCLRHIRSSKFTVIELLLKRYLLIG